MVPDDQSDKPIRLRPAPRREVTIRLSPSGLEEIDRYAAAEQRTRSDMIRVLLGEAIAARRKREARR